MASEAPAVVSADLERVKARLRDSIHWRDMLAEEVAKFDAIIRDDARAFATLNGDLMRPTLDQLRRMLFDQPTNGKG